MGTPGNVFIGPATLYTAPVGTSVPTVVSTTGLITPASPWVAIGFTEDGITIDYDQKVNETRVEEQSTPVLVTKDTSMFELSCTLAEDTVANMLLAYGSGSVATVAAASGIAGSSTLTLSDTLNTVAVVAIATNPFGFSRMLYVPTVYTAGKVSTKYRRAAGPRTYSLKLTAACAPSSIIIEDITASHA